MIFAVMFLKTFTLAKILNFYFRNNFQNFFLQLFSGVFLLRFSGNLYFCKKFKTFPLAIIFKIFNYLVMEEGTCQPDLLLIQVFIFKIILSSFILILSPSYPHFICNLCSCYPQFIMYLLYFYHHAVFTQNRNEG